MESGEEKARLEIPGIPMLGEFSEDDSQYFLVSFRNDESDFYVFDTAKWEVKSKFTIEDLLKSVDIKEDGSEALLVMSSNTENQLKRISLKDGEVLDVFPRGTDVDFSGNELVMPFLYARYSGDRENIIAVNGKGISKISIADKTLVFEQEISTESSRKISVTESEEGGKLSIQSYSRLYILDGGSGEITDEVYFPELDARFFTYNPSTNTVVGFGEGGKYAIWKDKHIVEYGLPYGASIPTESVFLKNESKLIVNSHESRMIKIIDMKSRISSDPIQARIMSNSNDFSKILLFDGSDFAISGDYGKTSKKLGMEGIITSGTIKSGKSYIISNDGRYFSSVWVEAGSRKPLLRLYDLESGENREVYVNSVMPLLRFSEDGKIIYIFSRMYGLELYRTEDLEKIESYPDLKESVTDYLISEDGELLVWNSYFGSASLYNLKSREVIANIPGQALCIKRNGEEIILKGIQNNSTFTWSSKEDIKMTAMDEACAQTPMSFDDVNVYNEKSGLLLMIRNNEMERRAYVVDFESGELKMSFALSIKNYDVNGNISPDGKSIAIDQNYSVKNYKDSSAVKDYFSTAVYHILSEEEVEKEVEKILAGRVLTDEEKEQIGISTK